MLPQTYYPESHAVAEATEPAYSVDTALDEFLHARPRILKTKLDVLAAEVMERFRIRDQNLLRLRDDATTLRQMISEISHQVGYGVRQHSEKSPLYSLLFGIHKEERDQDTDCWKDVVDVMRDFLTTWEAHEQARSRAILLQ